MSMPSESDRCQRDEYNAPDCGGPFGTACNPVPQQFRDYSSKSCNNCPCKTDNDPVICNLPQPGPPYVYNDVDCTLDCSNVDTSELEYIKPNVSKYGLLRHSMDEMRCLTLAKENAAADIFAQAEW
jgi:hypothetical protein